MAVNIMNHQQVLAWVRMHHPAGGKVVVQAREASALSPSRVCFFSLPGARLLAGRDPGWPRGPSAANGGWNRGGSQAGEESRVPVFVPDESLALNGGR